MANPSPWHYLNVEKHAPCELTVLVGGAVDGRRRRAEPGVGARAHPHGVVGGGAQPRERGLPAQPRARRPHTAPRCQHRKKLCIYRTTKILSTVGLSTYLLFKISEILFKNLDILHEAKCRGA